jgi:predicted PurR-regulated permease PerM
MENKTLDRAIIFFGMGILLVLSYLTLKSLLFSIFLAFIFGYAFRPAYNSVKKVVRSKTLSALIIILAVIAIIIIPLIFFVPSLIRQTFDLYSKVQDIRLGSVLQSLIPQGVSQEIIQSINLQFSNVLSKLFSSLVNSFSSFLTNIPIKLINFTIFVFIFYFVLIDFDKIGLRISEFIPLSMQSKKRFGLEFKNVTEGILYGQILIGILQGIMMGLMLFILGVEGTLLFTIIAIIAGILPMIGPTIIWIPLGIILVIAGFPIKALILAIWGLSVSGITDGLIRPYILSRRTSLPLAWGFISTIGGLLTFGLIGLLLGPLIISYLIIIIQFYKEGKFEELFRS